MGGATTTMITKQGVRIGAMIESTGGVEGASTQQSTICRSPTTTVRQQQSGQQILALEPGERCKRDRGYQGSTPTYVKCLGVVEADPATAEV